MCKCAKETGYSLIPFRAEHAEQLEMQTMQATEQVYFGDWDFEQWSQMEGELTFTGLRNSDREVLGCAGLIPQWKGRSIAWAWLSNKITHQDMVWIHRQVTDFLDKAQISPDYKRIEASVHEPFKAAHRWVTMLGFKSEGLMKNFDPAGEDCRMYSRIAK